MIETALSLLREALAVLDEEPAGAGLAGCAIQHAIDQLAAEQDDNQTVLRLTAVH